jgi:hypothetical protein
MPELLRNLVPFAGAFVGSLALAWTVAKFSRKRLQVEVLQAARVTQVYSGSPETLEWEGVELPTEDIYEVLVDVQNSGNVPIASSDFERPLTLLFDSDFVLLAEVLEEIPEDIGASVSAWSSRVRLAPVLLNAGDVIGLKIWVQRFDDVKAEGRVVGVGRIHRFSTLQRFARNGFLASVLAITSIGILFVTALFSELFFRGSTWAVLGFSLAALVLGTRNLYRSVSAFRRIRRRAGKQRFPHGN